MNQVNKDKEFDEVDDDNDRDDVIEVTDDNDNRGAEFSIKRSIKPATSAEVKYNKSMFDQMMSINERNKKYFYPNKMNANARMKDVSCEVELHNI